jgi:hypothetical protein
VCPAAVPVSADSNISAIAAYGLKIGGEATKKARIRGIDYFKAMKYTTPTRGHFAFFFVLRQLPGDSWRR